MTPPDIVDEQLRGSKKLPSRLWVWIKYIELACEQPLDTSEIHPSLARVTDRVQALREEVQLWKDRFFAERQDHEATMKAWDAERSGW